MSRPGDDPYLPHDETPAAESARGSVLSVPDALLPVRSGPSRWRIAARPLTGDRWVSPEEAHWPDTIAMKRRLLATRRDEVAAIVTGAESACEETAEGVVLSTGGRPPSETGLDALIAASLTVADDLCVLVPDATGILRLGGAVLCSPNRWRLTDKIGSTMAMIHAPVARYREEVGAAVDSLLARLDADRPVWRSNWGVLDNAALFQPTIPPPRRDVSPAEMWLRVEHQTLRRLRRTGAVLFTIRTHLERLGDLAARSPDAAREVGALVSETPDDVADYKSLSARRDEIVRWCSRH